MSLQLTLGLGHQPTTTVAVVAATSSLSEQITRLAAQYGVDPKLAANIIWCESKDNPNALRLNKTSGGIVWSEDHGLWQINDFYQEVTANKLGYDIYNEDSNLRYGFYLLSTQGTKPWNWSRGCWSKDPLDKIKKVMSTTTKS